MFFVGGSGGGFPFPGMDGPGGKGGFPFPGMDGHPGGKGKSQRNVDTTKLYTTLEVDKNASEAEIKKAYKKMAIKHHPDKGGDSEKFKDITRAYEVLSDADKRSKYDRFGEEGLEDGGAGDPSDLFNAFFGGGRPGGGGGRRRMKTQNVVQPLKVTLEQLYNGQTKKMAITRQVVDKKKGMTPQGGFKTKSEREVLEVHIQKGSPDDHKVVFREMADEHPQADCGDVIFILKEQQHKDFKRKGADLYIERRISLVEALCGFELEITHLDGRKLLVKTAPGQLVKPMPRGFDPLESKENKMEWDVFEDCDCPSLDNIAEAETTDADTLKKACETQLKRRGIDVGAFVVTASRAGFKQASREECMAARQTKKGATMYVLKDPNAADQTRLMKAIKDEGMPTYKNPFIHGNLFVIFTIEFPEGLSADAQASIRKVLPPALNSTSLSPDDEGVEQHIFTDIDPVASFNANKINMQVSGDSAYDDDDEGGGQGMGGPQGVQCQQQ